MNFRIQPVCALIPIFLSSLLTFTTSAAAQAQSTTTTLALTSAGSPVTSVVSGSVVTLTATVKSGSAAVTTGQVSFCDASAVFCSDVHLLGKAQLTSAGTAAMKFIPGTGNHSYKAIFAGTPNGATKDTGSTSSAVALSVTATFPTTTMITASGSTGNYTLTATVTGSGSSLPPTGAVSFLDTSNGNLSLGAANLTFGTAGLSFLNSSNPPAGSLAWSTVAGDFNGDGILDLAVANYGDGTVSILLGKGDGTFTPAANSPITVTFDPESLVVGDFNGDGKLDLAMENSYYNGVVTILLGNGDGTFTPAANSPITVGGPFETPGAVAMGDFNGDGIPDLIATNANNVGSDPGVMTVLLGKGDGTFTPTASSPVSVGSAPISIAVGDFNRDGMEDLALVNFDGNNVTILLGNGDGTFTPATNSPLMVGSFPTSIAMGDFNGDGILDLAVTNSAYTSSTVGSLTVLLGNGDGTFATTGGSPITVGGDPVSVTVGDFNGDGKADLAVANNSDDTVMILLGSGNGQFMLASNSPIRVGDFPQSEAPGDFNGDGITDVAVANSGSNTDSILLVQLTQTATATVTSISPVGSGPHLVEGSYAGDAIYLGSNSSTVSLSGSPAPGFTVSGTSVSVSPGATTGNISMISVTPSGGFTGSVLLTATITSSPAGAQNLPTLSFGSTSPVNVTSATAVTATLTISTAAPTSAALAYPPQSGDRWYTGGSTILAFILLLGIRARGRDWGKRMSLLVFLVTVASCFTGCGGGVGNPGTTRGNYTITVTGTSGNTTSTSTVALTVQ